MALVIVGLLLTFSHAVFGGCPASSSCGGYWVENPNGFCYLYCPNRLAYAAAQAACEKEGADLVSIHSNKELKFILDKVALTSGDVWVGLRKDASDAEFSTWADGSPKCFLKPVGLNFDGDCVQLDAFLKDFEVGDDCNLKEPFICKLKQDNRRDCQLTTCDDAVGGFSCPCAEGASCPCPAGYKKNRKTGQCREKKSKVKKVKKYQYKPDLNNSVRNSINEQLIGRYQIDINRIHQRGFGSRSDDIKQFSPTKYSRSNYPNISKLLSADFNLQDYIG